MSVRYGLLAVLLNICFAAAAVADPHGSRALQEIPLPLPAKPQAYLPQLTRLQDGTLLCAYSSGENWRMDAIKVLSSRDGGKTWTKPVVALPITSPGYIADPNFLVIGNRATLFATFVPDTKPAFGASEFRASETTDRGQTWSPFRKIPMPHKYVTGKVNAPVRLRDGTWVMGYSWELGAEAGKPAGSEPAMRVKAGMLRSKDDGLTWKAGEDVWVDVNMGPDEPAIIELKNGDLFAIFRSGDTHPYEGRSRDGGQTWEPLRRSRFEGHNTPSALLRLKDGSILRMWDHSPKVRYPLVAAVSTDECETWSKPRTLTEPQKLPSGKKSFDTACYPSAVQADDGTIFVLWWETGDFGSRIRMVKFAPEWLTAKS